LPVRHRQPSRSRFHASSIIKLNKNQLDAHLEPTISAGKQPQTYVLDHADTGTGVPWRCPFQISVNTPTVLLEDFPVGFYQSLPGNAGILHEHFLPQPFQFCIHLLPCYSTLYQVGQKQDNGKRNVVLHVFNVCMCTCMWVCAFVGMFVYVFVCICACGCHKRMNACVCVRVWACTWMWVLRGCVSVSVGVHLIHNSAGNTFCWIVATFLMFRDTRILVLTL
jgi:hypothetical protein